jgi:hypothetical protein
LQAVYKPFEDKQGDAVVFGEEVFRDNLPRIQANALPHKNLPLSVSLHLSLPGFQ